MPKEFHRTDRIGQAIQYELAHLLRVEASDPRFAQVSITGVEVSRDLAHAKIFLSTLVEDQLERKNIQKALKKASGFLRTKLVKKVKLRIAPELHFKFDDSHMHGLHLSSVIEKAIKIDSKLDHNTDNEDTTNN